MRGEVLPRLSFGEGVGSGGEVFPGRLGISAPWRLVFRDVAQSGSAPKGWTLSGRGAEPPSGCEKRGVRSCPETSFGEGAGSGGGAFPGRLGISAPWRLVFRDVAQSGSAPNN